MSDRAGLLIDTTLCTGCEKCVVACKEENHLGKDQPWREQESISDLSATRWSTIIPRPDHHYVRSQCHHCLKPACASACIVGALSVAPTGAVVYDADRCMGCRYCMLACPYAIPRYQWDRNTPRIQKCTLCEPRIAQGRRPACVEACPEKALLFGTRAEMIAEGHRRIEATPGRYLPRVWGEKEFGGTSVMYISDVSLDFLKVKPTTEAMVFPELTWAALRKVPGVVMGMGTLMAGVYWVIGRRMHMAALAAEKKAAETSAERTADGSEDQGKEAGDE
jgi:formate dehydrogenase iron-sulfur subunit